MTLLVHLKGEHLIPAGANLVLLIYAMHRNPRLYPDPLVYNPERFFPDQFATKHPYSFIPFSAGPRNCIGNIPVHCVLQFKSRINSVQFIYRSTVRNDWDESPFGLALSSIHIFGIASAQGTWSVVSSRSQTDAGDSSYRYSAIDWYSNPFNVS